MTLNITESNSSLIAEDSVLWDRGDCDYANVFSFKFGQQSDGYATNTERCKRVKVELLVAITLIASVTICILNSVCTVSYIPVCVSLLLQKQPISRIILSLLMVINYITISVMAGNKLITQFTTKPIVHRHIKKQTIPHIKLAIQPPSHLRSMHFRLPSHPVYSCVLFQIQSPLTSS
jgi:hypothetical protein